MYLQKEYVLLTSSAISIYVTVSESTKKKQPQNNLYYDNARGKCFLSNMI